MDQLMYRPAEAARMLGIGRTAVFGFIKSGRLRSVKLGGYRLISADALRAFVRDLEEDLVAGDDTQVT
jgi:excisionase family DNA binding protein